MRLTTAARQMRESLATWVEETDRERRDRMRASRKHDDLHDRLRGNRERREREARHARMRAARAPKPD